jgi:hypothetical protein
MVLPSARLADSTEPSEIPPKYARRPNGVLAYIDGDYAWSEAELSRFPRRWFITVLAIPELAERARAIDVEHEDATPASVPPYRDARAELGLMTYVYCDRVTVPEVLEACGDEQHIRWIISTLDNNFWTPVTLVNNIRAETGAIIDATRIAAIQAYSFGTYDESLVYGDPMWELRG